MHEQQVTSLLQIAAERLVVAQQAVLQVPDKLGSVSRTNIGASLTLAEQAIMADVDSLRGSIATAHAFLRRCRFPSEEHDGLFRAMTELSRALEDLEQCAAAADYPANEAAINPANRQVVSRTSIPDLFTALDVRLSDFDDQLERIDRLKSRGNEFEDQNALVDYVVGYAGVQSTTARGLSRQEQVDVTGISHAITGLGRVVAAFVATVTVVSARVTEAVRSSARALGRVAQQIISITSTIASQLAQHMGSEAGDGATAAPREPAKREVAKSTLILLPFFDMNYYVVFKTFSWEPDATHTNFSGRIVVPKGFVTSLDSIPSYAWSLMPASGRYGSAVVLHDWLYWDQALSRETADGIFDIALQELGMSRVPRKLIWTAVRTFGSGAWDQIAREKFAGSKRVLRQLPDDPKITWEQWRVMPNVFA